MSVFRHSIRSKKFIRKKWDNFFGILVMVFGFVFVFYFLLCSTAFMPWFKIERIDIFGNRTVSGEIISEAIREKFNNKILWLIPRRSTLLFRTNKTEAELLKKFPKISAIEIDRTGLKSLKVNVTERDFTALWCYESQNCFLIDDEGVAYERFPEASKDDLLILENSTVPKLFAHFSNQSIFNDILRSISFLTEKGFNVSGVSVKFPEIYINLREGGQVMLGEDFLSVLMKEFSLLLNEYQWKTGQEFEYVDLRFPNKAFIKQ